MLVVGAGWSVTREPLLVFGAAGQLTCALVAVLAVLVLARSSDSFECRGGIT